MTLPGIEPATYFS